MPSRLPTADPAPLSDYERERLAQIQANEALFRSLGLAPEPPAPARPPQRVVKRATSVRPAGEKMWSSPRKRQRGGEGGARQLQSMGPSRGSADTEDSQAAESLAEDAANAPAANEQSEGGGRCGRVGAGLVTAFDAVSLVTDDSLASDPASGAEPTRPLHADMDLKEHDPDDTSDSYETERLARIRENEALLFSLGLLVPAPPKVVVKKAKPVYGPKSWTSPREQLRLAEKEAAATAHATARVKVEVVQGKQQLEKKRKRSEEAADWASKALIRAVDDTVRNKSKKSRAAGSAAAAKKVSHVKTPARAVLFPVSTPSKTQGKTTKTPKTHAPIARTPKISFPSPPSLARSRSSRSSASSTLICTPPPALPTLQSLLQREPSEHTAARRSPRDKARISYSSCFPGGLGTLDYYNLMRERALLRETSGKLWPDRDALQAAVKVESSPPAMPRGTTLTTELGSPCVKRDTAVEARVWIEIPYRPRYRKHAASLDL